MANLYNKISRNEKNTDTHIQWLPRELAAVKR